MPPSLKFIQYIIFFKVWRKRWFYLSLASDCHFVASTAIWIIVMIIKDICMLSYCCNFTHNLSHTPNAWCLFLLLIISLLHLRHHGLKREGLERRECYKTACEHDTACLVAVFIFCSPRGASLRELSLWMKTCSPHRSFHFELLIPRISWIHTKLIFSSL